MVPRYDDPVDRDQTLIEMVRHILVRLDDLEQQIDQLDRRARPFGDGTPIRTRGRHRRGVEVPR